MNRSILAVFLLLLAGCSEDVLAPAGTVACDGFLLQSVPVPGDTVTTAEGIQYIDVRVGTGDVALPGTTVDVNYSGYLLNGTRFDSSCPANRAVLRFTIGSGDLIRGFELGATGMRPGGIRRVVIPPRLGYGSAPVGSIPANSTLVFDLELVSFPRR